MCNVKIVQLELHVEKVDVILDALKGYIRQAGEPYFEEIARNTKIEIENQLKEHG